MRSRAFGIDANMPKVSFGATLLQDNRAKESDPYFCEGSARGLPPYTQTTSPKRKVFKCFPNPYFLNTCGFYLEISTFKRHETTSDLARDLVT